MVKKVDWEKIPFSKPHKGPIPLIDREEGLPPGGLDIACVENSRKGLYHWSQGLKWYERLHAHATLNSARKHVKCKRPFEPKDELDFVLGSAYCPNLDTFPEKTDPYLQIHTALGEDMNITTYKKYLYYYPPCGYVEIPWDKYNLRKCKLPKKPEIKSWRLLKNRTEIEPEKYGYKSRKPEGIVFSRQLELGPERRENIYHVKLNIAADHSPQTNPGYSRTPSGAFYAI